MQNNEKHYGDYPLMKNLIRIVIPLLFALLLVSPTIAQGDTFRVSAVSANIRTGWGIEYDIIGTVRSGSMYPIIAYSPTRNWVQLDFGGTQGWVFRHLGEVNSTSNMSTVNPVVSVPVTTTTNIASLGQGGGFAAPSNSVVVFGGIDMNYFNSTIGVSNNLRLRSGPGLDYRILTVIPYGQRAVPLARNIYGTWILVDYNGTQGWIYLLHIAAPPSINLAALPVQ
jgi:uncharacterized protein YraI